MVYRDHDYLLAFHINKETDVVKPIGLGSNGGVYEGTYLDRVIVNKGGFYTLSLYDGIGNDARLIAQIINPNQPGLFLYSCRLLKGLAYTLKFDERHPIAQQRPFSITVHYEDRTKPEHPRRKTTEDEESTGERLHYKIE